MHALKVLREDHDRIEGLLEGLSRNGGGAKDHLFERLEGELSVHVIAEDNVFLPQVEDAVEDGRRTSGEFFGDDGTFGRVVETVAAARENHREILALLGHGPDRIEELGRLVRRQVEIEESLYPEAEKVLEAEDFERIGDLVEHCKWQVRGMAQARLASSSAFRPAPEPR